MNLCFISTQNFQTLNMCIMLSMCHPSVLRACLDVNKEQGKFSDIEDFLAKYPLPHPPPPSKTVLIDTIFIYLRPL